MKILLSIIADYIQTNLSDLDVKNIIHLFNIRTAEIESFKAVPFKPNQYFVGQVTNIADSISVFCHELNQTITLPKRTDVINDKFYLITHQNNTYNWSSLADFGSEKEGLMPAVHCTNPNDHSWKTKIPETEYILDVDNKSINHRPDLWGHYGIAREMAIFLHKKLIPLETLLAKQTVIHAPTKAHNADLTILLENPQACARVAGAFIPTIATQDSHISMAITLARCNIKPINAIVDLTNMVMLELGHPMHAFDAATFSDKTVIMRMAHQGEHLKLLDDQTINLEQNDIVIANTKHPVSLAGIMGGKDSGIDHATKNIIIEAAGFDPLIIRKTATRTKLRTESCMRFEKHLDPMNNINALQRFIFLATEHKIISNVDRAILSTGINIQPTTCSVSHQYFENQLGTTLETKFIEHTLKQLEFNVEVDHSSHMYHITIPTFRATKDIKAAHDIAEEVIRFYGFENLKTILPGRQTAPFNTTTVQNTSYIKRFFAYTMNMHELKEYLLYDEAFVQKLPINRTKNISVRNPMSENWTTLVNSLIPHLLKAIEHNIANNHHLRFFEHNATWIKQNAEFIETKKFAGIIFDKKEIDFYAIQQNLITLFSMLDLPVTFQKPTSTIDDWYHPFQVVEIICNHKRIGLAGMMHGGWISKIHSGSAFVFEIDDHYLINAQNRISPFKAWSKFQDVTYDISIMTPRSISAQMIKNIILDTDTKITSVDIIDFFEKEEWDKERAITLRYTMNDATKTMTKQDIDQIVTKITKNIKNHDIQIR